MTPFVIRPHLSESTFTKSLALNGVVDADETPSIVGEIYMRYEDDTSDLNPVYLGKAVAGHSLKVPIDLQGRPVRLFLVSKTEAGRRSVANITEAEQVLFTPSTTPVLADLTFDSMTGEVTGTIAANQGTGTIRIMRQFDTLADLEEPFVEVDTVTAVTTSFIDSPPIDGNYHYKLLQDGQAGESNTREIDVTGVSGSAGSPPTLLSGTFDGIDTVSLSWTNNGGTGSNIVEQKIGSGGTYVAADSVASGTAVSSITVSRGSSNQTYYYRVRNESVVGYSNEESVFVPREV